MNRQTIWGALTSLVTACVAIAIVFFLSDVPTRAQQISAPSSDYVDALWVAGIDGILKVATADGTVLFDIPQAKDVRALAVGEQCGTVWAYSQGTLNAYRFNGELFLSVPVFQRDDDDADANYKDDNDDKNYNNDKDNNDDKDDDEHINNDKDNNDDKDDDEHINNDKDNNDDKDDDEHIALAVNSHDGTVWLGIHKTVFHFDARGQRLITIGLARNVQALALDETAAHLWIATRKSVSAYDAAGRVVSRLELGKNPRVKDIAVDADSGEIWVALHDALRRYDPGGTLLWQTALNNVERIASDGQAGIWAATNKKLLRLGPLGQVLVKVQPFSSRDVIVALVADPTDQSAWVARHKAVSHIGADGDLLHHLDFHGADADFRFRGTINDLALCADIFPPTLAFSAPRPESLLPTNSPEITLSYRDSGIGVDPSTLHVQANGQDLVLQCSLESAAATCQLSASGHLPEGRTTLTATIADYAGNTSEPAQVSFTIDTVPPAIVLDVPRAGTLTNQPVQLFAGHLSEAVQRLTLEGQPVAVGPAHGFSHSFTLQEGAHTYQLAALDLAGNMGARSVRVTLDTVPPVAVDPGQLGIVPVTADQVSVSGPAGSVEAGATVTPTNLRTGAQVSVTANPDGSFTATIAAQPGDQVRVIVTDQARNDSSASMMTVPDLIPPILAFTAPAADSLIKTAAPTIEVSYSDIGDGVDPNTLHLQANGQEVPVQCTFGEADATCTLVPPTQLPQGLNTLTATVADQAGNVSEPAEVSFTVDSIPPVIALEAPGNGTLTRQPQQTFMGHLSEAAILTLEGQPVAVGPGHGFSQSLTLQEGAHTYQLTAVDAAGNVGQRSVLVTLDSKPPAPVNLGQGSVAQGAAGQISVSGSAGSVEPGATIILTNLRTGAQVSVTANPDGSFTATIAAQPGDSLTTVIADPAGNTSPASTITVPEFNHPPVIVSIPVATATVGQLYSSLVEAMDPDPGDAVTLALTTAPAGMSLTATGPAATALIQWTPGAVQVGTFTVIVTASDGRGGSTLQQYQVTVTAPEERDLAVAVVDIGAMTTAPQTLVVGGSVQVEIQNRVGAPFSGSFEVLLFEDRNGNGTFEAGVDNVLGTERFAGNIPGQGVVALEVRVSGVVRFRDNRVYALVDSANQIAERDETNNLGNSGQASLYRPPVGDFQPKVKWEFNSDIDNLGALTTPLVVRLIDTNGDSVINERDVPAVIFPWAVDSHQFSLMARRGDTGALIFHRLAPPGVQFSFSENPAVGDLDGDGTPEIVVGECCRGVIHVFNNDGTWRWTSPDVRFRSSPTIADLDGDGRAEILYGATIFNYDGTIRATRTPSYLGGTSGPGGWAQQAADLDGDGVLEIIAGPSAFDHDGKPIWFWEFSSRDGLIGTLDRGQTRIVLPSATIPITDAVTAIANLDDDPYPEVLAVVSGGFGSNALCGDSLWIFEHDGRIKPGFPICLYQDVINLESYWLGAPTIADFAGNGRPEILIPARKIVHVNNGVNGTDVSRYILAVYERDGRLKWRRDDLTPHRSSVGVPPAVAYDFDGDGAAEVVYLDSQKFSIRSGRDGATLYELGVGRIFSYISHPVVADVGNNGCAEIVVPAEQSFNGAPRRRGVLVVGDTSCNWRNARPVWNQWLYHVTNVNDDGTIPRQPANNWQTLNNSRTQVSATGVDALAASDLTVSKVTVDTQTCPASLSITARIGNGGGLHVAAGQRVNFYGGDPAAGGTLIGSKQTTRALYPGEFEDVTLTNATLSSGQAFVTVNEPPLATLTQSPNLARLPHTWAEASGYCTGCTEFANTSAYAGIDGSNFTRWVQFGVVPSGPSFFEVHPPFPVNVNSITIQNAFASNTCFLTGTVSLSNGYSTPIALNASGEGTVTIPEQQHVSWVRLSAATTCSNGPSLSEFIVGGSYVEPQFRLNEGTGRAENNTAASAPGIPACGSTSNQPPQIVSAPPITARTGVAYTYAVQTFDPNNDP